MAIALVNDGQSSAAGTNPTLAFTCNSGTNLLVVGIVQIGGGTLTAATYGGTAMTILSGASIVNGTTAAHLAYLYSPTTGSSQTIALTMSAGGAGRINASAWSGADTAFTPVAAENSATSNNPNTTITPTRAGGTIVSICAHESANVATGKGTGQTAFSWDPDGFIDEGVWNSMASYELNSTTTADTQSFTAASSDIWAMATAYFAPPAGGTTVTLTPATETDTAQALSFQKRATLAPATETDAAQPLSFAKHVALTPATEVDGAQPLTATKQVTLEPATETDGAQPLSYFKSITLTPATEADEAMALSLVRHFTLGPATETDEAVSLFYYRPNSAATATQRVQRFVGVRQPDVEGVTSSGR